MFVRDDWTRRGLGRRILEACEAAARNEGFHELALMATLPGIPLYLAYGFETIEEGELALVDGVKLEYATMTKPLNGA
jgi:GNAT superfamily N-acetyltransferase